MPYKFQLVTEYSLGLLRFSTCYRPTDVTEIRDGDEKCMPQARPALGPKSRHGGPGRAAGAVCCAHLICHSSRLFKSKGAELLERKFSSCALSKRQDLGILRNAFLKNNSIFLVHMIIVS